MNIVLFQVYRIQLIYVRNKYCIPKDYEYMQTVYEQKRVIILSIQI